MSCVKGLLTHFKKAELMQAPCTINVTLKTTNDAANADHEMPTV